uniref:Uncharacterized protein n=1 Tax=Strigamia maritima TaxID=126957 RepID=T1IQ39_STRMM
MSKLSIVFALFVCTATAAFSPMDVLNLVQQPQVANMAKDYVVNSLAGPLSELRNNICSSPLLDEDKMASTLSRAADNFASVLGETANIAPQLQDAITYVSDLTKNVMSDPSFQPQLSALQKQLENTLDYLGDHFDEAVDAASKVVNSDKK